MVHHSRPSNYAAFRMTLTCFFPLNHVSALWAIRNIVPKLKSKNARGTQANSAHGRMRCEACKFKASLGYKVRPCLKKLKNKKVNIPWVQLPALLPPKVNVITNVKVSFLSNWLCTRSTTNEDFLTNGGLTHNLPIIKNMGRALGH
jgi:hypothetical protein